MGQFSSSDVEIVNLSANDVEIEAPVGRGTGAGPTGRGKGAGNPTQTMGLNPQMPQPVSNVGGFLKENLPMMGGIVGSGAAAMMTGGLSLPVQIGMGLGAGAVGAGVGQGAKYGLDAAQGIPTPPGFGGKAKGIAEAALTEGIVPELTGQALGLPTRAIGNVASRVGARTRNRATIAKAANPTGHQMSAGAREVGTQTQIPLATAHKAAKDPLTARYDALMKSPWGQARTLQYTEHATEPRMITERPDQFTMGEDVTDFTIKQVGPTNAKRHELRSNALDDARGAKRRDDPKAARRENARAAKLRADMETAARDNGLSMDEYNDLSSAWQQMSLQFDNNFMKQARNQKGSNFVDMLLNPKSWKTNKRLLGTESGDVEIPLDNPGLLANLRENVGEDAFSRLQVATQKAIIRRATDMHGDVRPTQLDAQLKRMIDYGAADLVPNAAQLREMARILDKGTIGIPKIGKTATYVERGIQAAGLDTPDLARRMKLDKKGAKGSGQKLMEWLGRIGSGAFTVDTDIPEPPR